MAVLRRSSLSFVNNFKPSGSRSTEQKIRMLTVIGAWLLVAAVAVAQQDSSSNGSQSEPSPQDAVASAAAPSTTVTVAAGTQVALVLTHPVQSRHIHRGDDVYAEIVSPVTAGNEVLIPPGTLVQGKFDKLAHNAGRGELTLQSLSVIFPDGYVAPMAGPVILESNQGYTLNDPGRGRVAALLAGPFAGAGLGALIGHEAAGSSPTTITSTLPPGCTGPPPGCLTSSVTGPAETGKDTVIGAAVGSGIGLGVGLLLMATSHHFFLDAGAPMEMTLQQPLTLQQDQVSRAVRDEEKHPVSLQPTVPLPQPPSPGDTGTCWTPGTPGTPGVDIPGTPPIGNSPGTPGVHIPGTPGTPPIPHPCP